LTFFNSLQLAAVIHRPENKDCFCVHGGVSPSLKTLDDIEAQNRFCEIDKKSPIWDLLWSDPMPETVEELKELDLTPETAKENLYVFNIYRHSSVLYSRKAVSKFLKKNNLCCIIRGHQVQQEGYCEHFYSPTKHRVAPVLTLFSAPNYCDQYGNRGAYLTVNPDGFVLQQFYSVIHPHVLPDFMDCFSWSLPMLLGNIVSILQTLVVKIIEEEEEGKATDAEQKEDSDLAEKTRDLYERLKRLREEQEKFRAIQSVEYHPNMELFETVLRKDSENEACPTDAASSSNPVSLASATSRRYVSFKL